MLEKHGYRLGSGVGMSPWRLYCCREPKSQSCSKQVSEVVSHTALNVWVDAMRVHCILGGFIMELKIPLKRPIGYGLHYSYIDVIFGHPIPAPSASNLL
jgi:hypothetical protein